MDAKQIKDRIAEKLKRHYGAEMDEATPKMIYDACALAVRDLLMDKWVATQE